MKANRIDDVKTEIRRLIEKIDVMTKEARYVNGSYCAPRETGAVRRASMDLTRALADLRSHKQ
jgi:hypothetical protein